MLAALFLILSLLIGGSLQAADSHELQTVPYVDLNRYMGTWYQIARLQEPWLRECDHNPMAIYTMKPDGTIHVLNQCQADNFFTKIQKVEGTAEIVDQKTHAKLKISFDHPNNFKWLFSGDYWIIQLADDYSYAVVSEPTEKHIWILSRTPSIAEDVYQSILDKLVMQMPDLNILNVLPMRQDPLDKREP
jgi:apolipoprotein D and lipocalin family protein